MQSLIFKDFFHKGNQKTAYNLPERTNKPDRPYDACRLHGSLTLNKVAGNFHITAGKSLHFSGGHIHITSFFDEKPMNFTHRINRFSFGDTTSGIVHPLEGDEKIFTNSKYLPCLSFSFFPSFFLSPALPVFLYFLDLNSVHVAKNVLQFLLGSISAQYFIEVVPTDIETFMSQINTYQYSVKENIRPIGKFLCIEFFSSFYLFY